MDSSVEQIIADARAETGEVDYSPDNGVPQSVPLEAANTGQEILQGLIFPIDADFFLRQTTMAGVINQVGYTLPENDYLGGSVSLIEYSPDGTLPNYYELKRATVRFQNGDRSNEPRRFFIFGGADTAKFYIDPYLASSVGSFRVSYTAALDSLAVRSGRIATKGASRDASNLNYLKLTLDSTDATLDDSKFTDPGYICINDKAGTVTYYNLSYDSYDASSHTFILSANQAVSVGTIADGDYVTYGKYTTTHSKLKKPCKPYLSAMTKFALYSARSSVDSEEQKQVLSNLLPAILGAHEHKNRGRKHIPYSGKFIRARL